MKTINECQRFVNSLSGKDKIKVRAATIKELNNPRWKHFSAKASKELGIILHWQYFVSLRNDSMFQKFILAHEIGHCKAINQTTNNGRMEYKAHRWGLYKLKNIKELKAYRCGREFIRNISNKPWNKKYLEAYKLWQKYHR